MITEPTIDLMANLQESLHTHCLLCGKNHPTGYHLSFELTGDNGVRASFDCDSLYQGYNGYMHGGVISSLLDAAMTNCLFAHGRKAVTGILNIRFVSPVLTCARATVKAWIERSDIPLHYMQAALEQNGRRVARASATFMEIKAGDLTAVESEIG